MRSPVSPSAPDAAAIPSAREESGPHLNRRAFLGRSLALAGGCALALPGKSTSAAASTQPNQPVGLAQGIHPGRVVWAHDPEAVDWPGPGHGHWWESNRVNQERIDAMMAHTLCGLTGASGVGQAWHALFRHLNQSRGRGQTGYQAGQKILIKPNWVGMIYREGHVDPERYTFIRRQDYMNTAPQLIIALLRQLTDLGVRQEDLTVCDTLAYIVHEYHGLLSHEFPNVRYEDYAGKFGRIQTAASTSPLYWSSRPENTTQDYVPASFQEADYLINFANLKAHQGSGVTLCAKNHYGSLVRWPVQKGYYDMHPACFAKESQIYRPQVDLMGHAHLGGKTVLHLVDGLFSGLHPRDPVPQRMKLAPFNDQWPCSLFASQDPVAIDSVALDFLQAEWADYPHQGGVDDYLHEAALAHDPPSGTVYDPNHPIPTRPLPSLGVHEHWNNPQAKQYSRNLGTGEGIELTRISRKA